MLSAPMDITPALLWTGRTVPARGPAATPKPDARDGYVDGTWPPPASPNLPRPYSIPSMPPDGLVFRAGGDATGSGLDQTDTGTGAIGDPVANTRLPAKPDRAPGSGRGHAAG